MRSNNYKEEYHVLLSMSGNGKEHRLQRKGRLRQDGRDGKPSGSVDLCLKGHLGLWREGERDRKVGQEVWTVYSTGTFCNHYERKL